MARAGPWGWGTGAGLGRQQLSRPAAHGTPVLAVPGGGATGCSPQFPRPQEQRHAGTVSAPLAARARVPRAPEPASPPRAAASRGKALRCPSWALRSEAPPSVFCRLRNHSPGTIRPRMEGSAGLLPAGQAPSLTCPRPLMNRALELEAQSTGPPVSNRVLILYPAFPGASVIPQHS